ncbi:alpha/beta fold hydrolase [Frigidibacter sp. MR17.24]|uniref:alpha/beta fold hydrolase n=1 Tax=Frigidibacter sp. MR17.24 TaxID=3127345 RepID=UPI003012B8CC
MERASPRRFPLAGFVPAGGSFPIEPWLSHRSWGQLAPDGRNAILLPSHYTGTSDSYDALIGPGRALDPGRHFIVAVDMFGNGRSTSPSHAPTPAARAAWPLVTIADNIRAQALLAEALGIRGFALVQGWSMGALQAWHWAAMWPDRVKAILPVCGAARCWPQNRVFLEGIRAALTMEPGWQGGAYATAPEAGLRAFGRAYCGWAYSPRFFRDEMWRAAGFDSLEALLLDWERDHLGWEAADLIAMLDTWASADLGVPAAAWHSALASVRARAIVMPCDTDRYFTLEENAIEVACVPGAELRPILSPFGHSAGAPARWPDPSAQIEAAARELLGT